MGYRAYPEYKASGVEWLDQAPSHWSVERLRFSIQTNPTKSEIKHLSENLLVSFVPMEAVGELGGLYLDAEKEISEVSNGYSYFADGDVLIAKITPCFENGKGAIAKDLINGVGFGTTELHVLRSEKSLNRSYLFYLSISHAFREIGASQMLGAGGQKRITDEFIRDFRVGLPSLPEQEIIADFLDHKTTQIDRLIEKKRELIEKLQEQRIATITQAVTKGLDSDIALKNIELIGDIPAHWDEHAIKFGLSTPITDGPHETPEILSEGIPFLSAEAVKNDTLDFDRKRGFISLEDHSRYSKKYKPLPGDIYMVKSGATTGNIARVETTDEFNIWSPLAALRPCKKSVITDFLFYFMKSKPFNRSVELGWNYGTQQNIGMGVISNLRITVPPLKEQEEIVTYLKFKTSRIDTMLVKVNDAIERLQEYRTALITAAVTGQIDVRDWQAPAALEQSAQNKDVA